MGLFDKSRKQKGTPGGTQAGKRNEINNKELKEALANAALSSLKQGEHYNDLSGLIVEFGYLFDIDEHGIEALFKVITDKDTFYFAAQKASVIRLNFDETSFNEFARDFLERHS